MRVLNESKTYAKRFIAFAIAFVFMGVALITSSIQSAYASELSETWFSVRALGMGNAYTAVVDDSDSLFYNPAGLARITGFNWKIFDLHGGLNGTEAIEQAKTIMDFDEDNMAESLQDLYGKKIWVGGGGKTAITMPGFGVGFYASTNAGTYMSNPAYPTMNMNYFFDYGITLGVGFDIVPNIMKFGIVGRRVNRTGTTLPLGPSVLASLDKDALESELKRRGTGYGFDLGTVITIPGPVSPTLSFVYKNMGYTAFDHEEGAGAPPRIEPEMIIGGALKIDTPLITITPAIDYKHMNRSDVQLGKKLHLGVEIDLPLIDIRAGLHQGYYTAGVGLDLSVLRFDAATYGVEMGEYPGQLEDRRYVVQATFELGFDPGKFGFGSSSKNGQRRRLKQRR